ncbi:MAG TPA: hypothetical protein VG929_11155 [Actinomycetota bacterium]|nr:hypothetical protein [Actinomycetota bacterium]
MADHGADPREIEVSAERVEALAQKILREPERGVTDIEAARVAARRMLQESEARTYDPAAHDHESDDVIRRSSSETASVGDTGQIRRVTDGE